MKTMTYHEMCSIDGGIGWTPCGVATGILVGSTVMYGVTGFLLTANKAWVACFLPVVL